LFGIVAKLFMVSSWLTGLGNAVAVVFCMAGTGKHVAVASDQPMQPAKLKMFTVQFPLEKGSIACCFGPAIAVVGKG